MKRVLFILLFALLLTSCAVNTDIPDETYPDEIPSYTQETEEHELTDDGKIIRNLSVYTKEDLYNIRNELNSNYTLEADIVFTEADFAEGGMFYNGGKGWEPIGEFDNPFTGIFDGNGHTISGLYINIEADEGNNSILAGLFGRSEGSVMGLKMTDTDIAVRYDVAGDWGSVAAGSVVANGGSITDCHNNGNVSVDIRGTGQKMHAYAGGITGWANELQGCSNSGDITATVQQDVTEDDLPENEAAFAYGFCGGIAGNVDNVRNCINSGNIKVEGGVTHNNSEYIFAVCKAGGIAGLSGMGEIFDCYNTGAISNTSQKDWNYVGGIIGDSSGDIYRCYNGGEIYAEIKKAQGDASTCAGGIIGASMGSEIVDCYNYGGIRGICNTTSEQDGGGSIGGIAGYNHGNFSNCYNVGALSLTSVGKHAFAGGIVGDMFGSEPFGCYYVDNTEKGSRQGFDTALRCTLDDMKKQETFIGFDFENVWTIDPTAEYPYPTLIN